MTKYTIIQRNRRSRRHIASADFAMVGYDTGDKIGMASQNAPDAVGAAILLDTADGYLALTIPSDQLDYVINRLQAVRKAIKDASQPEQGV